MPDDPSAIPDQNIPSLESHHPEPQPSVRSLKELIDRVTGRGIQLPRTVESAGLAETMPFPFLALVGQMEMKLALVLALINQSIGGVLLIGPRGTGKSTAVRSLVDLMPFVPRSQCYYGCLPEDVENGGIDSVCPDCARKYAEGEPLAHIDRVRLIELPLNAGLDDVIGGIDERATVSSRMRVKRGILSQADRNLLYVDEVNLLENEVIDALLDASAQGSYTVRRGSISATYWSRFVLVGSMNPEEGGLRPQILDRFGLRVIVHGLQDPVERLEAYRRVQAYNMNPRRVVDDYSVDMDLVREEIESARKLLPQVIIPDEVAHRALELTNRLEIDSLRAEITMFEASRAYAAAEARTMVTFEDIREVAPLALRLRRSGFMKEYFSQQQVEETELSSTLAEVFAGVEYKS